MTTQEYIEPSENDKVDAILEEIEEEREAERKKLEEETYNRINLPMPEKWGDLKQKDFGPVQWRIKDLIPWEGFVILAAVSGDRKTWIALEMAKSVALGIPFAGNKDFASIEGSVLYIDSEMPKSELQRRGKLLGLDDSKNNIFFLSNSDLNLNDDDRATQLVEFVEKNNIKVVIIDTLRASAGGLKEEKAEEVRSYFNRFKEIKDMGVSMVFLDHFRKPNHFEGKVPKKEHLFSSQDKTACVEVLLMIQTDDGANEIKVYQRKNRLGQEIKPFVLKMNDIHDEKFALQRIDITYGGEMDENDTKKEEAMETILELLKINGLGTKQIIQQVGTKKKIGEKNIREALRELVKLDCITQRKAGKENYYEFKRSLDPVEKTLFNMGKIDDVTEEDGKNVSS